MFVDLVKHSCGCQAVQHVFAGRGRQCMAYPAALSELPCPRCLAGLESGMFVAQVRHSCGHKYGRHALQGKAGRCRSYVAALAAWPCFKCLIHANSEKTYDEILADVEAGLRRRPQKAA